jgi:hypothetical protein
LDQPDLPRVKPAVRRGNSNHGLEYPITFDIRGHVRPLSSASLLY